jgi:putative endonuclease
VYIVECSNKSFYTGITTDIERRILQHNGHKLGGATYTKSHRPVTLRYVEKCENKSKALKRELAIKKLSHAQKALLITDVIK